MSDPADNFLDAEALLQARLKATLGSLAAAVGSMADMQGAEELSQITPAVYVIYDGYTPGQATTGSAAQKIAHRWLVVVTVRNVSDAHRGAAAREDAGILLAALIPALQGHVLSPRHSALTLTAAPPPVYQAGFAYIPTAWETTTVTHKRTDHV